MSILYSFIFGEKLFQKVILLASIILASYSTAQAIDGTYDGINIPNGWFINDDVMGFPKSLHAGSSSTSGNTLTITGGNITGSVFGGWSTTGDANNNTVILNSSGLNLNTIYGGNTTGTGDVRTGNRLILKNKATVGDIRNFEYYEFYMNKATDDALLTINGNIDIGQNAHFSVNIADGSEKIEIGDQINLMKINGIFSGNTESIFAHESISLIHGVDGYYDASTGTYGGKITSTKMNPMSITFPDSRLASFAFMNQANNLIFGQGVASAINAAATKPAQWAIFGVISGVFSGYDTYMDDITGNTTFGGPSFMVGGAKLIPVKTGELLAGAYLETGIGFIESDINTSVGAINTEGNANFYGAGAIVRYAMDNGLYTEGFFRLGALNNSIQSKNANIEHDSTSMYLGSGINLGYEIDLYDDRDMFDFYTSYTWSHLIGTDMIIDGQGYNFDAINSHRITMGAQYNFIQESMFSPYLGLAGEYELDAEANATIRGDFQTESPSLTGFTVISEIGIRIIPSQEIPLTMGVNLGGHFGKKNGVDTSFNIEYLLGSQTKEIEIYIKEDDIQVVEDDIEVIENENIEVVSTDEVVIIKMGEFLFETESYELTPEGRAGLQIIIDEIKELYPNSDIAVIGHTDNTGSLEYNQYISEQRAKTIVDIMKNTIDSEKLSYEGKAYTEPIDTNKTRAGRAKNRRVEIIITK